MKLPQTGGCQCGKIRYEITEAPQLVYTCHCTDCQRLTSSLLLGVVKDSSAEGTGFEPSVPRQEKWSMPSSSDQSWVGRTLTLGEGAEFSLEGRNIELSVSPKDIRTSPDDLCASGESATNQSPCAWRPPGIHPADR